jgi:hypothetical protein
LNHVQYCGEKRREWTKKQNQLIKTHLQQEEAKQDLEQAIIQIIIQRIQLNSIGNLINTVIVPFERKRLSKSRVLQ